MGPHGRHGTADYRPTLCRGHRARVHQGRREVETLTAAARDLGVSGERVLATPSDQAIAEGVLLPEGNGRIRSFRLAPAFGGQDW